MNNTVSESSNRGSFMELIVLENKYYTLFLFTPN